MNRRIYKKILKRCSQKFDNDKRRRRNMSDKEINSILTGLERKVWNKEQAILCRITDKIIAEMKAKGKW